MLRAASNEEPLRNTLRNSLTAVMRGARADIDPANRGPFMQLLFDEPHRVLPAAAAVLTTIMQVFTLWLAARIVRTSGRLRRPWPAIAEMRFPPRALMLLGGAFLVSMLPGLVGIAGSIATAAVLSAYALLGLAIIHALTRPLGARGFILGGLYAGIMVIGWPMLLMTILGIADNWLDLRARLPRTSPPAPLDRT